MSKEQCAIPEVDKSYAAVISTFFILDGLGGADATFFPRKVTVISNSHGRVQCD